MDIPYLGGTKAPPYNEIYRLIGSFFASAPFVFGRSQNAPTAKKPTIIKNGALRRSFFV